VRSVVCLLLELYLIVLIVRLIAGYFRPEPGSTYASAYGVLVDITEPVLGPCRRLLGPVRLGVAAIDLSPLIAFVGIRLLMIVIC
jgi:YggT family protein